MCLAVPGKIVELFEQDGLRMGKVQFGGIAKATCLAYTPEAKVDDYVIVHAGFAISVIDENEAQEVFSYLAEIAELEEGAAAGPQAGGGDAEEAAT